jgi:hypothetical protein
VQNLLIWELMQVLRNGAGDAMAVGMDGGSAGDSGNSLHCVTEPGQKIAQGHSLFASHW